MSDPLTKALYANELCMLFGGRYISSDQEMHMSVDPKYLMDPLLSLRDYGVIDGAELILL